MPIMANLGGSMDRDELRAVIEKDVQQVRNKTLNNNAFEALLVALGGNPVEALGKIFLGRDDAVDAARHQIERECVLNLLCDIDEAVKRLHSDASAKHVSIAGLVETVGRDVDEVVGVQVGSDSPPVRFEPGAKIVTKAERSGKLTGLKIGGPTAQEG